MSVGTGEQTVLANSPQAQVHTSVAMEQTSQEKATPTRLLIPAIGVNAPIESVGLASDGTLATPTLSPWDDAGWYSLGPQPGQQGSAVIDGHLDRTGGVPAVFWNLRNLKAGDQISVVDSIGKSFIFRVDRVVAYAPQDAPLATIFGNTDGNHLNLITCAGVWVPSQNQTTLRRVVYSTLEA